MIDGPLPLEISSGPFRAVFYGTRENPPIAFHPAGWAILDGSGAAVATVSRAADASYLADLLNKGKSIAPAI